MRKLIPLYLGLCAAALAADNFYLKAGDRVVFYGDSITDQRLYTAFTETYVVTRFPAMPVSFTHSGWGGDKVSGGGGGPVDIRLQRDVIAYRPTVMTVMLGMNDGAYRPFDQAIFDVYRAGYEHIVETMRTAVPGLRMTLIEASPYDDVTRPPTFDGGYNAVLMRYSDFVKQLATNNHLDVANLNTSVVADLQKAKEIDAALAQKILPDRVHPGASGHLLMAEALLKAWGAPATVSVVEIDGAAGKLLKSENTKVSSVGKSGSVTWVQNDRALPFPIDWADRDKLVPLAMGASDFVDALDREMLKVSGLAPSTYSLKIDGAEVAKLTNDQLAEGINLATLMNTPMMKQAADVHKLTLMHTGLHNFRWRSIQVPLEKDELPNKAPAMVAIDRLEEDIVKEQRAAAQPKPHRYEISQAADR
jgi:lysophospholipase L1-like esterase